MYILAYQDGIFKRAVTVSGENDEEIKNGIIADFGDGNLTFVKMTQEEFEAWEDSQPKPMQLPTTEERLKMAEDTLMFLLMGGM